MKPTETHFTDDETEALKIIADAIIPASAEGDLPSAADAVIFADILTTALSRHGAVQSALAALDSAARESQGKTFTALAAEQAPLDSVIEAFRGSYPEEADLLAMLTVQCYYRDDRVMQSHGMETRAPHPEGFTVDQGDWSLLEPMRNRPEFFRKAP